MLLFAFCNPPIGSTNTSLSWNASLEWHKCISKYYFHYSIVTQSYIKLLKGKVMDIVNYILELQLKVH